MSILSNTKLSKLIETISEDIASERVFNDIHAEVDQIKSDCIELSKNFEKAEIMGFLERYKGNIEHNVYSGRRGELSKIFCVDDDPQISECLRDSFSDKFDIVCSETTQKAKDLLNQHKFGFIVCDFYLDEDDIGTELVKYSNKRFPDIPVIVVSGTINYKDIIECLNSGSDYFLKKPFEIFDLERAMRIAVFRNLKRKIRVELELARLAKG